MELLDERDLVLEIGAWADPFPRADWVVDLNPYETRGLYGDPSRLDSERLSADRWLVRDVCDHEPLPFADNHFDYVVCSHTLEDIRDPVWVCGEMARVSRAGYIEVPAREEEQTRGVHGPFVGWSHHHWLCDIDPAGISFVLKPGVLHGLAELEHPRSHYEQMSPSDRIQALFWRDTFAASERIFFDSEELHSYLKEVIPSGAVAQARSEVGPRSRLAGLRDRGLRGRLRRALTPARRLRDPQ